MRAIMVAILCILTIDSMALLGGLMQMSKGTILYPLAIVSIMLVIFTAVVGIASSNREPEGPQKC